MKKYSLEHAIRDFDVDILAKGAELALADRIKLNISKNSISRAVNGYNARRISSENIEANVISASFDGVGHRGYCNATVLLDDEHQELIYSHCTCKQFEGNHFACEHIAASIVQYFIEKDGPQILSGGDIEKQLVKNTGIEHPLTPGIMRKTDRQLAALVKNKKAAPVQNVLPLWLEDSKADSSKAVQKNTGALSVECIVYPVSGAQLGIEIKAGPKKHFVIKNITQLLDSYESNSVYKFSQTTSCPGGRAAYENESVKFMDFFLQLYKLDSNKRTSGLFTYGLRSEEYRTMVLSGRDLDAFMELSDGGNICVQDADKKNKLCRVDLAKEPISIRMRKTEFGAMMFVPEQHLLGCGLEKIYLQEGDYIISLPSGQWEQRKILTEVAGGTEGLYIQDRDLPGLCTNLLSLSRNGQLKAEGFEMETFLPEMPKIEIYLDLPQDDVVSCKVMAVYASGKKYNIFEEKTNSKARNELEERRVMAGIAPYFTSFDNSQDTLMLLCPDDEALFIFLTEIIPRLSELGEVMVSDSIKKLRFHSAGNIAVGVNIESGSLVVNLKSQIMDKEEIIEFLCKYDRKKKFTRLKNGVFISTEQGDSAIWESLSDTFKAYGKKNPEAMKIPLFRALYLDELLEDKDSVTLNTTENYRELLRNLRDEKCRNYPIPKSLKEILRPYQRDGFRWIKMLKDNGFGGILADDMGLGKTLQTLSFLLSEKLDGKGRDELRTIIITPASLVYNWQREIRTFTPELTCCVVAGSAGERRKIIHEEGGNVDILITSYDLLKRDVAEYEGMIFANEIIDEAQFIKNQNTQAAKSVRVIESGFRLALTGTPIENRLSELWSIFDYLMPGFLYSYSQFRQDFEIPVISDHDQGALDRIRALVHPFILRRLKKDVLKDLPDKIEETLTVHMEGEQRKLYDAYAERLRLYLDKASDEEFHESKIEILAELTKLRQICCGPEIILDNYQGANAKKEACMELVRQSIEGGHKLLLFSQFTSVLDVLENTLKDEQISYHRIDGGVSKENRMKMVTSFEKDDVPVFLVSLKAGGTGLNLTAADIVIHYDPWWNVAAQNQATDRAHRIGQMNTVTVYQILAENTIEEHIVNLQQAKAQLATDVLEGEGISSILIDKNELLGML